MNSPALQRPLWSSTKTTDCCSVRVIPSTTRINAGADSIRVGFSQICPRFSPLYSLTHLLDGSRGKLLKYSQAFTQETGSAVTFSSMVFD
jgi:hypothetical protein